MAPKVAIHWFRKGLRLHDNPSLLHAIEQGTQLLPLFILDPWFVSPDKISPNRFGFLLQCLEALNSELEERGSRLVVAKGKPEDVFRILFDDPNVSLLTFETDTEPYARTRDSEMRSLAAESDVSVFTSASHTLYDPAKLLVMCSNKAPLTMTSFLKLVEKAGEPDKPCGTPATLPSLPSLPSGVEVYAGVPNVTDLPGYEECSVTTPFKGGEKEAFSRMDAFLSDTTRTANFSKPQTSPTSLCPDTTALSPYLKTGSLSPRLFYVRLCDVYRTHKKHTSPPVSLLGQLYWREFYYLAAYGTPNFDRMEGNAICRQIPWDTDEAARGRLGRWEQGQTGFPAVDAAMNQLRQEGWMHHLARHLVACFLTRGDLWVSWEMGRDVFDRHLVDADWSLNNGNWMWLSASAFFHQYFRVYSPVSFFKKTDANGDYIRKYVPQLAKFPAQYIYEPWKAPRIVQERHKCIIGKDYPKPMVDHAEVSKQNKEKMASAYSAGKTSQDEEDGDKKGSARAKRQKK